MFRDFREKVGEKALDILEKIPVFRLAIEPVDEDTKKIKAAKKDFNKQAKKELAKQAEKVSIKERVKSAAKKCVSTIFSPVTKVYSKIKANFAKIAHQEDPDVENFDAAVNKEIENLLVQSRPVQTKDVDKKLNITIPAGKFDDTGEVFAYNLADLEKELAKPQKDEVHTGKFTNTEAVDAHIRAEAAKEAAAANEIEVEIIEPEKEIKGKDESAANVTIVGKAEVKPIEVEKQELKEAKVEIKRKSSKELENEREDMLDKNTKLRHEVAELTIRIEKENGAIVRQALENDLAKLSEEVKQLTEQIRFKEKEIRVMKYIEVKAKETVLINKLKEKQEGIQTRHSKIENLSNERKEKIEKFAEELENQKGEVLKIEGQKRANQQNINDLEIRMKKYSNVKVVDTDIVGKGVKEVENLAGQLSKDNKNLRFELEKMEKDLDFYIGNKNITPEQREQMAGLRKQIKTNEEKMEQATKVIFEARLQEYKEQDAKFDEKIKEVQHKCHKIERAQMTFEYKNQFEADKFSSTIEQFKSACKGLEKELDKLQKEKELYKDIVVENGVREFIDKIA